MKNLSTSQWGSRIRRPIMGVVPVVALVVAANVAFDAAGTGAATSTTGYRLQGQATKVLKATLTELFLSNEKRTHTLSASAQVSLDTVVYSVGPGNATYPGPVFLNPTIVDGPGHKSWAYAEFVPVAHSALHDQVALQDGGNIAIFEASPTWHILQIGVGWPTCVKSVLRKFAPAPAVALWLAHSCQ